MTRLRLLPIVLFAATALLCLKVAGLVTGIGSFAVGPLPAAAQDAPRSPDFLGAPLDLAAEADALRKKQAAEQAAAAEGSTDVVAGETPDAPAGEPMPPAAAAAAAAAPAPAEPSKPGTVTTERPQEFVPPDRSAEEQFVESLTRRREELDQRSADLELREKLLQAAEAKLQARIDELKGLEAQLDQSGGAGDAGGGAAGASPDEELRGLVTMYEAMKPKAAARVFNDLNLNVLLAVSRAMNPRKMSAILAVMEPGKAAVLTTALAGNQQPREIVIRRDEGDVAPPPAPASPEDLPKIMPAPPSG